ncbi:MAG: ABC transporter ATP-binding protein [Bacteroidetes bacterium]|nr:ABC transporter ATP-binding protein [Bacteroidota bacterium]
MQPIIQVSALNKSYKDFKAVNELNLTVYKGDVYGFLGPNGAGKSTTIRMLLTLIYPSSGEIKIFDKALNQHRNEILSRLGAIVEKPDFYGYLTAFKNLELLGKIAGKSISSQRIMEVLELVGLKERYNSKVKTYSQGMKQRLGFAQAILHDPELIILDEPTNGLDPQGMKDMRDLILHLSHDLNKTVFISSHILNEVELMANRMVILNKGKAVVEGNVQELLNSGEMSVTFEFDNQALASASIAATKWEQKLISSTERSLVFSLFSNQIPELNAFFVAHQIAVQSIVPLRSLENYFLSLTD